MSRSRITPIEKKYLTALIDMRQSMSKGELATMSEFCRSNKLDGRLIRVLVEGGIIENFGSRAYPSWDWTSIKPNILMVRKCLSKVSQINKESQIYKDRLDHEVKKPLKVYSVKESATMLGVGVRAIQNYCKESNVKKTRGMYQITDNVLKEWQTDTFNTNRKVVINNLKPRIKTIKHYEVKMLFGLVSLKFRPVY